MTGPASAVVRRVPCPPRTRLGGSSPPQRRLADHVAHEPRGEPRQPETWDNGGGRLHSHAAPAALPAPIERRSYPPCGSLLGRLRRSISDPEMSLTPDITSGAQASQASASAEASTVYSDVGAGQRQGRREFPSTLGLPLDRQAQKSRLQRFEREVLVRGSRAVSTVGGHFRQRHLSARSLRDSTGRTLSF